MAGLAGCAYKSRRSGGPIFVNLAGHDQAVGAFAGHTAAEVGQFSEDGLSWWDGTTWIATAQIVLHSFR